MKVHIIGAGLSGLASAVTLASQGIEVEVYEARSRSGGMADRIQQDSYGFDTGPQMLTRLDVWMDLFERAGEDMGDWFTWKPIDPVFSFVYPDKTHFDSRLWPDFGVNLGIFSPGSELAAQQYSFYTRGLAQKINKYLLKQAHFGFPFFMQLSPRIFFPLKSVDQDHRGFFQNPKVIQLFNFQSLWNRQNPRRAPASENYQDWLLYGQGAYWVDQGFHTLPEALTAIAQKKGVVFHYDTKVVKILTEGKKVRGLATSRGDVPGTCVITAMDIDRVYSMLPEAKGFYHLRSQRGRSSFSELTFFWGMKGGRPYPPGQRVFLSPRGDLEISELDSGLLPSDPTVILNVSGKEGENWRVAMICPADSGQQWEHLVPLYRQKIISLLEQRLEEDIAPYIDKEWVQTPRDIAQVYNTTGGRLYGPAITSPFSAVLRHPNKNPRYRGLYHVGASVFPGGGASLAALSGRNTALKILK